AERTSHERVDPAEIRVGAGWHVGGRRPRVDTGCRLVGDAELAGVEHDLRVGERECDAGLPVARKAARGNRVPDPVAERGIEVLELQRLTDLDRRYRRRDAHVAARVHEVADRDLVTV